MMLRPFLLSLLVFGLALVPRTQYLGQQVTADEDLTLGRSSNFDRAIAEGRWSSTYQIGHPEVTVMWVAALTMPRELSRELAGKVGDSTGTTGTRKAEDQPRFLEALAVSRMSMAVVHALLISLATLLVWRLAPGIPAVLAGVLLATEPFLVAQGRILRADALLAELMLVAVLSAVAYWRAQAGHWSLALCAVATGLALLTKTTSVLVLPIVVILALTSARRRALLGWLGLSAVTYVALWPSMWVRPMETLRRVADYTLLKGGSPMDAGSFFWGEALPDPGLGFYPVVLLLRVSPLVLVGALLLVRFRARGWAPLATALLMTTLLCGAAIALAPKKADRYVLPLIPPVIVIAALGTAGALRRFPRLAHHGAIGAIVVAQCATLATVWQYPLSYYNPLLGGGRAASSTVLVGWGEGLDRVAELLNQDPQAADQTAAVFYPDALGAQFVGQTVPLEQFEVADYAVLYIASTQRNLTPPALREALEGQTPRYEVWLNGISYAQVYDLRDPEFAGGIVLESIDLDDSTVDRRAPIGITLRWRTDAALAPHWRTSVTLMQTGSDVAVESEGEPQSAPAESGTLVTERHVFAAPARLGRYRIGIALEADPSLAPLDVVYRPPGMAPLPRQLIYDSVWVRVQ